MTMAKHKPVMNGNDFIMLFQTAMEHSQFASFKNTHNLKKFHFSNEENIYIE